MFKIDNSNLIYEMAKKGITAEKVAFLLGQTDEAVISRLTGNSDWIYEEVVMIRNEWFPDLELGYLFQSIKNQEAEQ